MPVAPEVDCLEGDDDEVPEPSCDLLLTARAEVGLGGLERLNAPYLDLVQRGRIAHSRMSVTTTNAAATST